MFNIRTMKKLILLLLGFTIQQSLIFAQNPEFPNAIRAKINLSDFQLLADASEGLRIGPGFELGYFRNVSPFINLGLPVKVGIAKLPGATENAVSASTDLVAQVLNTQGTGRLQPFGFAGIGYFFEQNGENHAQIPVGAGLNLKISKYAFAHVQAEYRYAFKEQRNNLQAGIGFVYLLHKTEKVSLLPPDSDKDGTPDALDKCPTEAGPPAAMGCPDNDNDGISNTEDICPDDPGTAATKGCPDFDGDGVADKDDQCPTDAGAINGCPDLDKDGFADNIDKCPGLAGRINGCPDTDNDGIADNEDKCPEVPGSAALKGCPAAADDDNDGVPNDQDQCPTAPGTLNGCPDTDKDGIADKDDPCPNLAGPKKYKGCPDTDGDEVADNEDKCPTTVGLVTNFGCPEIKKETKERLAFAMKAVQFEVARATIKQESYAILEEIVGIMNQYPDYKLKIGGHTDDIGDENRNLRLSTDRAKACHDYFLLRRIDPKRLRYNGFGESKPMADNTTPAGRELNRRVEFELTLD